MRGHRRRTEPFDLAIAITVVCVLGLMGGYMTLSRGLTAKAVALFVMAGAFALWSVINRRV